MSRAAPATPNLDAVATRTASTWKTTVTTPSAAPPPLRFVRHATLVRVIDGDTLDLAIDNGWAITIHEHVRLAGVNTPEKRGPERAAGKFVKREVKNLLNGPGPLLIESLDFNRTGKFGRTVARVWYGDPEHRRCLNDDLLEHGLAWPMDDGGTLMGQRGIQLLKGLPPEVIETVLEAQQGA